jgi:hypothetical protein
LALGNLNRAQKVLGRLLELRSRDSNRLMYKPELIARKEGVVSQIDRDETK